MSISRLKWRRRSRQTGTATAGKNNQGTTAWAAVDKQLTLGSRHSLAQNRSLGELPHRGFVFCSGFSQPLATPENSARPVRLNIFATVTAYRRQFQRLCLVSLPKLPRNSARSVELLIFVTNQGSGPTVDACSGTAWPIGIGPKTIG
jgi:hypothetical protein